MREIFAKILYETEKHNDLVLVTLIENSGSAPRKTGSQMLVGKNGRILGTIGGGAVELRSAEMAVDLIREKRSDLHPFILNTNDKEDIGMICGGGRHRAVSFHIIRRYGMAASLRQSAGTVFRTAGRLVRSAARRRDTGPPR